MWASDICDCKYGFLMEAVNIADFVRKSVVSRKSKTKQNKTWSLSYD